MIAHLGSIGVARVDLEQLSAFESAPLMISANAETATSDAQKSFGSFMTISFWGGSFSPFGILGSPPTARAFGGDVHDLVHSVPSRHCRYTKISSWPGFASLTAAMTEFLVQAVSLGATPSDCKTISLVLLVCDDTALDVARFVALE
jgi:hypothetical protein